MAWRNARRRVLNEHLRACKLQSFSRIRTLCRASPKIPPGRSSGLNFPMIFRLKHLQNFGSPENAPKSLKNDLGSYFAPILINVWIPLGTDFLYISWLPENSCFATNIMRNACFCPSRPLILTFLIHPKIMAFQDTFLHTLFDHFMLILYEIDQFWDPF